MKQKICICFLLSVGLALLSGCGSGGGSTPGAATSAEHESRTCIGCHEGPAWKTPGNGQPAVAEWIASTHNSTSNGASCQDCHGSGYLHPASCNRCHTVGLAAVNPLDNPDANDRCANCHARVNPRPGTFDGFKQLRYSSSIRQSDPAATTAYTHYSSGSHGTYVATNYKQYCRKCHNPHDTVFSRVLRQQWAESGHGDTQNLFVTSNNDFKTLGSRLPPQDNQGPYCVRCHTTTGYVNFVKSNFTDTQALPDYNGVRNNYPERPRKTYTDTSREVIGCNACHDDGRADDDSAYSGRVRTVTAPSIWYMYSSHPAGLPIVRARHNVQYDSLGTSNVCVPCHAGRDDGAIIKIADIDANLFGYTSAPPSGIRPHDFPAAANLQGQAGFDFYTSAAKYKKNPTHKTSIGGTTGPCITCHMSNNRSHSFSPVDWADGNQSGPITAVRSEATVCIKCHNEVSGMPSRSVANMNRERDYYRAASVALGKMIPEKNNWKVFGNYSVPGSGTASSATGTMINVRAAAYTMGANFVQVLCNNDPAGYAHNPVYTKQLMYDAIDWLADGMMDYGTASTQVYDKVNSITADLTYSAGKPSVVYGQNGIPLSSGGVPFTKEQVFRFICKNYDSANPTVCKRW